MAGRRRMLVQPSLMVRATGIEPVYLAVRDFKSLASTSFATLAFNDPNNLANLIWEALHNAFFVVQTVFIYRSCL